MEGVRDVHAIAVIAAADATTDATREADSSNETRTELRMATPTGRGDGREPAVVFAFVVVVRLAVDRTLAHVERRRHYPRQSAPNAELNKRTRVHNIAFAHRLLAAGAGAFVDLFGS